MAEEKAVLRPREGHKPNEMQPPEYFGYIGEVDVEKKVLDENVPMHWHEFCELEFVASGGGRHRLRNMELPYEAGVLFLLLPTDFHEVLVDPRDKPVVYNVKFSEAYIDGDIYHMLLTSDALRQVTLEGEEYRLARGDFDELCAECAGSGAFRSHMIKGMLEKLIIRLERKVSGEAGLDSAVLALPSQDVIVDSLSYIQQHYAGPITLGTLAARAGVSPNYYSALFRQSVGCTFREYLINVRMRRAISFLSNPTLPVYEVGERTGFNSYTHFERTFQKKFGMSPRAFREALSQRRREHFPGVTGVASDNHQGRLHRRLNQPRGQ